MRLLALCVVIVATFFVLSRTQVNEHAQFFVRGGGQVLEGTVSRDFLTGDFVIATKGGVHHVPQDQFGGMVYEGSAVSTLGCCLGGAVILGAGLLTLAWPFAGRGKRKGASK